MHEQTKLAEADYFLGSMKAVITDPAAFRFNLSAFLNAARSVLQYSLLEADTTPNSSPPSPGKTWYDGQVAGKPAIKFFKDKRNINIHQEPVSPPAHVSVQLYDVVQTTESVSIQIIRADGRVEVPRTYTSPPPPRIEPPPSTTTYSYRFPDWTGPEDVVTLCTTYLADLRAIVADGVAKGFLTP
jgi:hypothetical protein